MLLFYFFSLCFIHTLFSMHDVFNPTTICIKPDFYKKFELLETHSRLIQDLKETFPDKKFDEIPLLYAQNDVLENTLAYLHNNDIVKTFSLQTIQRLISFFDYVCIDDTTRALLDNHFIEHITETEFLKKIMSKKEDPQSFFNTDVEKIFFKKIIKKLKILPLIGQIGISNPQRCAFNPEGKILGISTAHNIILSRSNPAKIEIIDITQDVQDVYPYYGNNQIQITSFKFCQCNKKIIIGTTNGIYLYDLDGQLLCKNTQHGYVADICQKDNLYYITDNSKIAIFSDNLDCIKSRRATNNSAIIRGLYVDPTTQYLIADWCTNKDPFAQRKIINPKTLEPFAFDLEWAPNPFTAKKRHFLNDYFMTHIANRLAITRQEKTIFQEIFPTEIIDFALNHNDELLALTFAEKTYIFNLKPLKTYCLHADSIQPTICEALRLYASGHNLIEPSKK